MPLTMTSNLNRWKHHRSMQPMSLADASITTGKSIATSLTMQGKFSNKSPNGGSMMPKHLTCCRNMNSQTIATTQLPRWLMIQQPTKSMASTIPIRKVMWWKWIPKRARWQGWGICLTPPIAISRWVVTRLAYSIASIWTPKPMHGILEKFARAMVNWH